MQYILNFAKLLTSKRWPERSIAWLALSTRRNWSPRSEAGGIGGSEQAVINLSRQWAGEGYSVTVYTKCRGEEGAYAGVRYLDAGKFNRFDRFDTLIIWRNDNIPYLDKGLKAERIWLELQDVVYLPYFTENRMSKVDRIFVKSLYHKSLLPEHAKEKAVIIPNGIKREYLNYDMSVKDPYKLIYASGYNRGLEHMLRFGWPVIKKELSQAELHVFAPWGDCPFRELLGQPGVAHRGRVGVEELMREKAGAAIHYYACTSAEETDCISIRESAAVGCVPVTTDHGVFSEKEYCVKVSGEPKGEETQRLVAKKIIGLIRHPEELEKIREKGRELAGKETWPFIARKWLEEESG